MSDHLSIGDVATLVGIKPGTLRAWEQRYEVVTPRRSDSRYRFYDQNDVEVLRHMRTLVDAGIPPRKAAAMTREAKGRQANADRRVDLSDSPLGDHTALARAASWFDGQQVRGLLDEAFACADVETVIDRWLMPSMRHVGDAWETGELDVASEHFASSAVMRKLATMFDATHADGPRVVVGLPASARHELPAMAFALCLRRRGLDVLYIGCDVPLPSWRRIVEVWRPRAVVLAAAYDDDVSPAISAADVLQTLEVGTVFIGGSRAARVPNAIPLPELISSAAEVVATTFEVSPERARQRQLDRQDRQERVERLERRDRQDRSDAKAARSAERAHDRSI